MARPNGRAVTAVGIGSCLLGIDMGVRPLGGNLGWEAFREALRRPHHRRQVSIRQRHDHGHAAPSVEASRGLSNGPTCPRESICT